MVHAATVIPSIYSIAISGVFGPLLFLGTLKICTLFASACHFCPFFNILLPLLHMISPSRRMVRIAGEESSPAPAWSRWLFVLRAGDTSIGDREGGVGSYSPPPGAPLLVPTTVTRGGVIHRGN